MTHEFLAYQIIIIVVASILILRTALLILRGKKEFRELIVAILIWGTFATLALFPNLSQEIADLLGFELGINFLLTLSTIVLFGAYISLTVKTDKNSSEITKLVRQLALEQVKEKDTKKN